jgi:hypothetical protein
MRQRPKVIWILSFAFIVMLMVGLIPPKALARPALSTAPFTAVYSGFTCDGFIPPKLQVEANPLGNGNFSNGTLSVTVSNFSTTSFDFSANVGVDAVIISAGDQTRLYSYNESLGDTQLDSPLDV